MKKPSTKDIIRNWLWFVNFRTMIKATMWWIWPRRDRTFFIFEGKDYTYREVYQNAERYANFFLSERKQLVQSGKLGINERLALGIYMDNTPEFIYAALGAGLSNSVLFAINTGFRGETLAKVINQAGIRRLIMNASTAPEVARVLNEVTVLGEGDILYAGEKSEVEGKAYRLLEQAVDGAEPHVPRRYRVRIDNFSPVIVIYTSGTTGMPKGVPCTHIKMVGAGVVVQRAVKLTRHDRGYLSMPLFHSNDWYIGILPQMIVGGSFVLKRKFSARAFEEDMLQYGVAFLNYVG
ncbi:MAG TPA: AMP-binding protein, partial [Deltaproteobacteria bacterium]|nr:AMP-binding protein [Deltaproteobacteria bacterium]